MSATKSTKTKTQTQEQELYKLDRLMWDILIYCKFNPHTVLTVFSEMMIAICMEEGMSKANVMQTMEGMWDRAEARKSAPDLWGDKLKECKK